MISDCSTGEASAADRRAMSIRDLVLEESISWAIGKAA